ncbi:hypothetical protein KY290_021207 [Solanum tuberosum]|uniref:Uncharacterized protein n=1 Tax=Solanum tuberosum TaxID=4113 RepID=A0ABQ7V0Y5_SOLTU|nr:hypothetical protein KY289_020375 [Solanum tuberosum]KAH0693035.1 hypothetical protein KY285_020132 [Solanum tuberosum]KAH0757714.1 hypothetical protein KY290_021207 [Solanum tuberosum]
MQASKASAEAAPGSKQGKDPGLHEAMRARMLALEDKINMVMGQYLGAVEGGRSEDDRLITPCSLLTSIGREPPFRVWFIVSNAAGNPKQISNRNCYKKPISYLFCRTSSSPSLLSLPAELVGVPLPRSSVIPFPREPVPLVLVLIGRSHICLLRASFLSKTLEAGTHRQRLFPLQPRHSGLGADLSVHHYHKPLL